MKILTSIFLCFFVIPVVWLENIGVAKVEAARAHKLILVNFSGSDWCGPCIRLHKEVFESADFQAYAADHLILVRADFPRQKRNQLQSDQITLNERLAEQYDPEGKFPYTLLIDERGKIVKTWDGFQGESAGEFVAELSRVSHGK